MAGCDKCLWCDQCRSSEKCEYFTPLNDEDFVDEVIEKARCEFRKEWAVYAGRDDS